MRSASSKTFVPGVLLAGLALISAQPAVAAPPEPVPPTSDVYPEGLLCEFEVTVSSRGGRASEKTFEDKNGNVVRTLTVATGVVLTVTAENGRSVSFKTSGSVTKTSTKGNIRTVTATGHNGLGLFPSDVPRGPSFTQYSGGRIVYTIDLTTGVFTLISASGNATDVCAALR
jgi:hypothetical protein